MGGSGGTGMTGPGGTNKKGIPGAASSISAVQDKASGGDKQKGFAKTGFRIL